jgi:hypothetical protein
VCLDTHVEDRKKADSMGDSRYAGDVALQVIVYEFDEDSCHRISIMKHSALINQEDWYSNPAEIDRCLFHCSCRAIEKGMTDVVFSDDHPMRGRLQKEC